MLASKFRLGLFEQPFVDAGATHVHTRTEAQLELAARVAADSLVLLKNDGVLPLSRPASVAVIGPNAASHRNMLGDYAYIAHVESLLDMARSGGNLFSIPVDKNMTIDDVDDLSHVETVLDALVERLPEHGRSLRPGMRGQR